MKTRSPALTLTALATFAFVGLGSAACVKLVTPPEAETVDASTSTTLSPPTGAFLWLDADHAASFTLTGAQVDLWRDRSGNGNHAIGTNVVTNPVLTANAIGGRPAVTFDGANDALQVLDHASLRPATELSACVVGVTSSATNSVFFYKNSDGSWTDGYSLVGMSPFSFTDEFQFWVSNYTAPGGGFYGYARVPLSVTHIWCGRYGAAGHEFWIDGSLATAVQASHGAIVHAAHGASDLWISNVGAPLNGQIAELLLYPRTLTDTEREDLEGYLAVKWGLRSSLPGGHRWR